jgi:glycosyltransferase involved in cell wall biosynthesis
MDRLSAVIIAQNEEQNLPACIESVSFADEILVCDGGSDDRTVDIAEALGATVVRREFDGFASQKNFIIDQAKGPWILSLDADERVTGELKDEIIELLSSSGPLADGYRMPRKGYFGGKWIRYGGWWPDYNLRLFRKGKGRFEEREVHESVNVEGEVETLSGPIEHRTYSDISDYLVRMDRYSTLAARQSYGENKRGKLSDIVLRPIFTFVKMYVFRQGFRDGYVGFQLAMLYAIYTFSKYAKVKEMSNKI